MNAAILPIVLPVFLVIMLGFCLKKTGLVQGSFMFELNRLIYYIALPSLLFHKIATADFSASFDPKLLAVMIFSTSSCCVFSYLYATIRGYKPTIKGAFCQGSFRGNLAYVGLAITFQAYGDEGFTKAGILLGFLVPLLNLLSIAVLMLSSRKQQSEVSILYITKQIIYNPLIVASLTGLLWSFLEWPIHTILDRSLAIVNGMALPLALIAIGASFSFKKLRGDLGTAVFATVNKIIILPLVTAALLWFFGVRGVELGVGVILAGTPVAAAAYIMAQQMDSDAELSGAIIALSTLCSLVTYTVMLYIYHLVGLV
ncbi:MAG: putative permease [Desulforhopalus sp.]|jgi:predicted permease